MHRQRGQQWRSVRRACRQRPIEFHLEGVKAPALVEAVEHTLSPVAGARRLKGHDGVIQPTAVVHQHGQVVAGLGGVRRVRQRQRNFRAGRRLREPAPIALRGPEVELHLGARMDRQRGAATFDGCAPLTLRLRRHATPRHAKIAVRRSSTVRLQRQDLAVAARRVAQTAQRLQGRTAAAVRHRQRRIDFNGLRTAADGLLIPAQLAPQNA